MVNEQCCRWAAQGATRLSQLEHRQHFSRAPGRRNGRAVRRSYMSVFWPIAFRRISARFRERSPSGGNLHVADE